MKSNPFEEAIAPVRDRLGPLGSTIVYYPTIGSTNDAAANLVAAGSRGVRLQPDRLDSGSAGVRLQPDSVGLPEGGHHVLSDVEGIVVVADQQTAGRGRRGHTWFSPPGSGLYVSVVLTPARARVDPARATTLLTLAAGVAIAEGIDTATGLAVDLKWPNDVFVGRRKIAVILAQGSGHDGIILGYGVNVAPDAYPPAIADRVTSLGSELGRAIDRHQLFADTLAALARRYEDLLAGRFDAILDAWRRRAPSANGARVEWTAMSDRQSGITEGIDDHGALLVRVGDRVERIVSGELEWQL